MRLTNSGLSALITDEERAEILAVKRKGVRLQYLKGSERMSMRTMTGELIDCRLWNVLSPRLAGYIYGPNMGIPTLGVEGLRKVGLI